MEDNTEVQEAPVQEPVQGQSPATPTQDDPPAQKVLYKTLVDKKFYSKSYDEFKKQFTTADKTAKLHDLVIRKGLYSKDVDAFNKQFFPNVKTPTSPDSEEKKKSSANVHGGRDSAPTAPPYGTPPVTSQKSNQPIKLPTYPTPGQPSMAAEHKDNQVVSALADKEHQIAKTNDLVKSPIKTLIDDYGRLPTGQPAGEKMMPQSASMLNLFSNKRVVTKAQHQTDILTPEMEAWQKAHPGEQVAGAPTPQGEITTGHNRTAFSETIIPNLPDFISAPARDFTIGVAKGVADLTKTLGDLSAGEEKVLSLVGLGDKGNNANSEQNRQDVQKSIDKFANMGMSEDYVNSNPIVGIGRMVPMLLGGEGAGAYVAGAQAWGSASTTVDKLKEQGVKFENGSDILYKGGSAVLNYLLMKNVMGTVLLKSAGQETFNGIVGAASADALKELADKGVNVTSQDFVNQYVIPRVQTMAQRIGELGMGAVKTYAKVGADFAALNLAESGIKQAVNDLNKKAPFDNVTGEEVAKDITSPFYDGSTPANGNLGQFVSNLISTPAAGFSALGMIHSAGMLFDNSPYLNPVIRDLQTDSSPEGIQRIKDQLAQYGEDNGWKPEDIKATHAKVDELADIAASIPKELPFEKYNQAVGLIMDRRHMEGILDGIKAKQAGLDPSLKGKASAFQSLVEAKVSQANDRLSYLTTDKPWTYFEHQGEYFKAQEGSDPQPITKDRYDLEVSTTAYRKSIGDRSIVMPEGSTDKKGNPEPPKKPQEKAPSPEDISDEDYEKFINKGTVSPENIDKIAIKVRDRLPLTEKEKAIFSEKAGDINESIRKSLLPDKPKEYEKETKQSEPAKEAVPEKPEQKPAGAEKPAVKADEPGGDKPVVQDEDDKIVLGAINEVAKEHGLSQGIVDALKNHFGYSKKGEYYTSLPFQRMTRSTDMNRLKRFILDAGSSILRDKLGENSKEYSSAIDKLHENVSNYVQALLHAHENNKPLEKFQNTDIGKVINTVYEVLQKIDDKDNAKPEGPEAVTPKANDHGNQKETGQKTEKGDEVIPAGQAAAEHERSPAFSNEPDSKTVYVATKSVKSDPAQFQPRGTDFSEETTDKVIKNFDDNKLDPIVIYKQADGTDVVLSGHSRLEAHNRLDALPAKDPIKLKAIAAGYKPGKIKARYFTGTLDQAKEFADRSNDLATKNKDYESAASIRKMRQDGKTETEINDRAKEDFGKDANYIKELSHLNPKGEVINALKQLGDSGDKATRTGLEKIASWIGAARARFGQDITNSHETEMFKFLQNPKNGAITTKADFVQRIGALVNNLHYNSEHPLNLNRIKDQNPGKEAYDHAYAELSQKVKDKQAEVDNLNDRLNNPKNPDYIKPTEPDYEGMVTYAAKLKLKKTDELSALRAELLDLAQKKGQYHAEGRSQMGIFDVKPIKTEEKTEADKVLQEDDNITTQDIIDYEQSGTGTTGEEAGVLSETVQQPGNDAGGNAAENQGGAGPQAEQEPVNEKEAEKRRKAEDAKRRFDNFIKNSRKTAGTFANLGEFLVRAAELMAAYAELGLYKFGQMLEKLRADFGDAFVDDNLKDLKSAYVLTRVDAFDANDENAGLFDDDQTIAAKMAELNIKPEAPEAPRDEMADLKTAYNKRKTFQKAAETSTDELLKEFAALDPRYLNPDEMVRYNQITAGKTLSQLKRDDVAKFIDDVHHRQDEESGAREKDWYKQLEGDPDFDGQNVKKALGDVNKLTGDEKDLEETKPNQTAKDALKKLLAYARGELRKATPPPGFEAAKQALLDLDESKLSSRDLRDMNRAIEAMVNDNNYAGSGKWIAMLESGKRAADILAAKNKAGLSTGETSKIPSQLRSLPLNTEVMVKDGKLASVVQERSGIFDISAGNARVNSAMNKVAKQFTELTDKMPKDIQSVENRYKRGVLAVFTQKAESDTPEEHFARYKEYVEATARRLLRSKRSAERKEGQLVQDIYDKYVKDATSSDDVVSALTKENPNNAKIVKFFIDKHKEIYPQLRHSALLYSGKELPLVENYTSTSMKLLRGADEKPIEAAEITDPVSMDDGDKPRDTDTGQSRTAITRRKSIGPKRVMNLNFDGLQLNKLRESHYDVQTLPSRHLFNAIRNQPQFKEALGNSQSNVNVLADGVATMVQAQRGFNHSDPVARMILNASDVATQAAVRIAIAGIDQFLKHYPARAVNTLSNLGADVDLYFKSIARIGVSNPIFNESAVSLRGLSKGGLDVEAGIRQMQKYDFSTAGAAMNALNKFYGGIDKYVTASLVTADELVARNSWGAYYMQDLRRRGIDIDSIDWENEHKTIDKEAAAYAEQMTARNEIPNDPTQKAVFDQRGSVNDAKTVVAELAKKLAMPFTNYSRNIIFRIENDIRKFYGGNKKEAAISLAATTAETASFQSMKILLKLAFGAAAAYILTHFDYDAPVTNPHWEELPAQTFDDMFLAGTGSMMDNWIKRGVNSADQLVTGNEKGSIFKNYDPSAYGQTDFSALGMYGVLPEKLHDTYQAFPYMEGEITGSADQYEHGQFFQQEYQTTLTDRQRNLATGVFLLDLVATIGASESSTQRLNSTIFNAIKKQKQPVNTHLETHHNKKSGSVKVGEKKLETN